MSTDMKTLIVFCLCLLAVFDAAPAVGQPKAGGAPAAPASPAPPVSAEACYAGYGLKPAQKIKICSDVIDSGSVKGLGLGLSSFNRGQALSNSGDPKGADEALKLLPNNIDSHDTRAFIYLKLGDFPMAINEYNASLQLEPNRSRSLYGRGLAKLGRGDKAGGDTDISTAKTIQTNIGDDFMRYGVQ